MAMRMEEKVELGNTQYREQFPIEAEYTDFGLK